MYEFSIKQGKLCEYYGYDGVAPGFIRASAAMALTLYNSFVLVIYKELFQSIETY